MAEALLLMLIEKFDRDADELFIRIKSEGDRNGVLHAKLSTLNDVLLELIKQLSTLKKSESANGCNVLC